MNSIPLCEWRTFFAAVLFETDQVRLKSRITDAVRAIDERLQSVGEARGIERISLEAARRSLAALEREPEALFVPELRLEKPITVTSDSSAVEEKRPIR